MVKRVAGALIGSISLNLEQAGFLHEQLYKSLRAMILDGALEAEQRLPSTRVLAEELGISRTTVLTVYDRLGSEGLLYSQTGAGSFVSSTLSQRQLALDGVVIASGTDRQKTPPLSRAFREMYKRLPIPVETSQPQAFSTAIPAIDVFPMNLWSRLVSRYSRRRDLVRYISSKGYTPLRQAIAAHLRTERGLECSAEQVYITSGAQQALFGLV